MKEMTKTLSVNEVFHNGFFAVTANFDMASYGDLQVEIFLQLEKAIEFAKTMKEQFLNEIPDNGSLDEESSIQEHENYFDQPNVHFYFYGVSENGENFVAVMVFQSNFMDANAISFVGGKQAL
ncbi:hypothetical protein LSPCS325_52070 [Lysinibacillus sp. CTST325]